MTSITYTSKQEVLHNLINEFGEEKIAPLIKSHERWTKKYPEGTTSAWSKSMSLDALSFLDEDETYWTFVAARIHLADVYEKVAMIRKTTADKVYSKFASNVQQLVEKGLYDKRLAEAYSTQELQQLAEMIVPERDLFIHLYWGKNITRSLCSKRL